MKRHYIKPGLNTTGSRTGSRLRGIVPARSYAALAVTAFLAMMFIPSCRTQMPLMNESLFYNTKSVNIYHMDNGEDSIPAGMVSETVDYGGRGASIDRMSSDEQVYTADTNRLDTAAVYRLSEVRVRAAQSFTPERDGHLMIEFRISVPGELLSTNRSMTLSPQMMYLDTIVSLDEIILRGENFAAFQEDGYDRWRDYLGRIVGKGDYADYFLDRDGIMYDIRRLQNYYLAEYRVQVAEVRKYERYKQKIEKRYDWANTKSAVKSQQLYYNKQRKNNFRLMTEGTGKNVESKYRKQVGFWPQYHLTRDITEDKLPKRYRQAFVDGLNLRDISTRYASRQDSLTIVANRYMTDMIVMNELMDSLREKEFKRLVPFPYREDMYLDTVVNDTDDVNLVYSFKYPLVAGMKAVDISMTSRVDAIDQSTFVLPPSDTLNFTIASIDQLFDTNLVHKRTKIYKNMYAGVTMYPKYNGNSSTLDIDFLDNRTQIDTLINTWAAYQERGLSIDSVAVTVSTSLEGSFENNYRLSQARAQDLLEYLQQHTPSGMNVAGTFTVGHIGEDWNGLVRLMRRNTRIVNKAEILDLLAGSVNPDDTKQQIGSLYPEDFRIIRDEIYPLLDKAEAILHMSYPGISASDTVLIEYREDYARAAELFGQRDYWGALEIMKEYPDYNLALVLTNLGFHARAYELLMQLEPTAEVHYLTAIVCCRLDEDMNDEALEHLLTACEMDDTKIYRSLRDPEIKQLLAEKDLTGKLASIVDQRREESVD